MTFQSARHDSLIELMVQQQQLANAIQAWNLCQLETRIPRTEAPETKHLKLNHSTTTKAHKTHSAAPQVAVLPALIRHGNHGNPRHRTGNSRDSGPCGMWQLSARLATSSKAMFRVAFRVDQCVSSNIPLSFPESYSVHNLPQPYSGH